MTESTPVQTPMVNLTIDGIAISVPKGTTVYNAAKQLGIEIPIFCYQDRMPPFGACRMCLVEVEKMPKLQASCTLEATEGMQVNTQSNNAVKGREGILEFLLINHPLDCPICDRGGECPLQDQTLKYGPGMSRFFEEKRHFQKALSLGPVLKLDRERCIVCARCTRFGDIIAGDHALEFIERGFKTEVGTPDGGPAKSKFIGNTIMICPVGALTSEVYRFRARPWDNKPTDSTCTLCPVGCSMILDSRDGEIMRTRSRENKDVNDMWLCDKGWFGYEFTSSEERLKTPLIRRDGKLIPASWEAALTLIAEKIQEAKSGGKIAGFGGNPLTLEENFLFQKLIRDGAGVNNLDHRIGLPIIEQHEEGLQAGMEISIGDCEDLSYAILFGLDLTEEFPVIWLRLKQAINKGAKVVFFGHFAPEIAPHLAKTVLHAPGKEVDTINENWADILKLLESGKKGAMFVGSQYLASPQRKSILAELQKIKTESSKSSPTWSLNILEGRGNSIGARFAGMRPDSGPLGEKLSSPGKNAAQVIAECAKSGWSFLYVAGADPVSKFPAKLWIEARLKLDFLVVQDIFLTKTARQANVVLPTLSYVEKEGTFLNIEGRFQKLLPGKDIPPTIFSDAEIFTQLAAKLNIPFSLESVFSESMKTIKLPFEHEQNLTVGASLTPSKEGLFATFAPALFDNGVRMKHNPHVIQLAKEPKVRIHPLEASKRGLQDNDKVRISSNGSSISGKIKFDDKVALSTAVLPVGFEELPVYEFGSNLFNGLAIEISRE